MKQGLGDVIPHAIPDDHSRQSTAFAMLGEAEKGFELKKRDRVDLVDLGCGTGDSYDQLKRVLPNLDYSGVDIEVSPEVSSRSRKDLTFLSFDGVNLPFESGTVDVVFCKQVLEHVRHPDQLIADVTRVLKPGGIFVGSVSFLEPYHSFSIFNWSPYGIVTVLEENGLSSVTLRPGVDGAAMIFRMLFGKDKFRASFARDSLFNYFIETKAENEKRSPRMVNAQKLALAGHICFMASKQALPVSQG